MADAKSKAEMLAKYAGEKKSKKRRREDMVPKVIVEDGDDDEWKKFVKRKDVEDVSVNQSDSVVVQVKHSLPEFAEEEEEEDKEKEVSRREKLQKALEKKLDLEWRKGKADFENEAKAAQEYEEIKKQKFTRSQQDVDAERKDVLREEDPMFQQMQSKMVKIKDKNRKKEKMSKHEREKLEKEEEKIEKRKKLGRISEHRYGQYPLPGSQWDGVDRSNGYESKLLANELKPNR